MSRTWLAADHHFGHRNIIKFLRDDGSPLRAFDSIEEHDETLIKNHNAVVQPEDRVYLLGDFGDPRKYADRLVGRKILVKGNHDDRNKLSHYVGHFEDIRAAVSKKGFVLTHIPIHPGSLGRWGFNIHGHTHDRRVMTEGNIIDPRYFCVSMEQIGYTPISLDEVLKHRPNE